jgi:acyl carrier protein
VNGTVPGRDEIVALLAVLTDRPPAEVGESIDSLELARLLYEAERRYGIPLDVSDDELTRMSTVTGAVEVVAAAAARSGHA